jgi:hypothetical protein
MAVLPDKLDCAGIGVSHIDEVLMFSHLPPYAGDPILSLMEQFQRDERSNKVNLSIGIYTDGRGVVPVLPSVRTASAAVAEAGAPYVYLPMEGHAAYRQAVAKLLFGADLPSPEHLAIVQTLGGSGALKVGADLIARFFPQPTIWLPDPTWDNHVGIFEGAGFKTERYPYYDAQTKGLNFNGMLDKLQPAQGRRGAAAPVLPQPDRRRPDPRAVGADHRRGRAARPAALLRPGLPGLCREPGRRHLAGA